MQNYLIYEVLVSEKGFKFEFTRTNIRFSFEPFFFLSELIDGYFFFFVTHLDKFFQKTKLKIVSHFLLVS